MQLSDLSKGRVLFEVKKAHGEGVVQENTGHLGGFKNYFYDILVCDLTIFDIYIYIIYINIYLIFFYALLGEDEPNLIYIYMLFFSS